MILFKLSMIITLFSGVSTTYEHAKRYTNLDVCRYAAYKASNKINDLPPSKIIEKVTLNCIEVVRV